MANALGIKQAWATTFYQRVWPDHVAHAAGIVDHLRAMKAKERNAVASGVAAGLKANLFESRFDLFDEPHVGVQSLAAFCAETLRAAVSHVNGGHVPPEQLTAKFNESWSHITTDGGFHDAHFHGGCSWCGIFYLQLGDSGRRSDGGPPNGGSRFYSPLGAGGRISDYGNSYLSTTSLDPPLTDGLLILFPSHLLHSGLPYRGAAERIVIAFNASVDIYPES